MPPHQQPLPYLPRVRYIILVGITVLGVGVVFYHHVENLSWLDSLYFCVITLTTIGYGDITPHTDAGKIFTIFYVIVGIGILAAVINYLLRRAVLPQIEKHEKKRSKK